jgi:hypothetical protein
MEAFYPILMLYGVAATILAVILVNDPGLRAWIVTPPLKAHSLAVDEIARFPDRAGAAPSSEDRS